MKFIFRSLFLVSTLSVVASCNNNPANKTANDATANQMNNAARPTVGSADQAALVAAVEPFEALAETAFTASTAELDKSIATAKTAVFSISTLVPGDVASRLQSDLARIEKARTIDQRADIAIASIEGFREVVALAPTSSVPADVSLLDYAGIRYDSDVQAKPPRWDDMTKAITYGRERVAALSRLAPATKLLPQVNAAFAKMENAIKMRDVTGARAAAKTQLDLVDELELAFAPPVKTR